MGFGTLSKCMFYYAMFKYVPHRLMCLNNPIGAREWKVIVCTCLAYRVAILGGVTIIMFSQIFWALNGTARVIHAIITQTSSDFEFLYGHMCVQFPLLPLDCLGTVIHQE